MVNPIQVKINEIFNRIEIYPEYSREVIKISDFQWNQNMDDFIVEYSIGQKKYIFQYNGQNPLNQFESELYYIKRMYERGIGAKEYYPNTVIVNSNLL